MKISFRNNKGFTLIELLVVVAIISLLSSVVLASLNTARAKARDAGRLSSLRSIRIALEYYYDKYGLYPAHSSVSWGKDCTGWRGTNTIISPPNTFLKPLVDEKFLPQYVDDPVAGDCMIQYRQENSGQGYRIIQHMETINNTNTTCIPGTYWYCLSI